MTARGVNHMSGELDRLIDWHVKEYRLSYAEVVGVLTMTATQITLHQCMSQPPEDPPPPEQESPVPAP